MIFFISKINFRYISKFFEYKYNIGIGKDNHPKFQKERLDGNFWKKQYFFEDT